MRVCCVIGCESNKNKLGRVGSFHRFPKKSPYRAAWIEATGRSNWAPKPQDRICGLHFEKKYFTTSGRLLGLTVPTLAIHQSVSPPLNSHIRGINYLKDYTTPKTTVLGLNRESLIKPNTTVLGLNKSHRDHTYAKIEVTVPNGAVDVSNLNFKNNLMQSPGLTHINVAQVENHPETNILPGHPNIKLTVSRPSLPLSVQKDNLAANQITTFGNLVLLIEPQSTQSENQPSSKEILPRCCIGSCKSDASNVEKVNGLHFHRFPHDAATALKWVEIVRRTRDSILWTPNDEDVVCSKHFKPSEMINLRRNRSTWTLQRTAIPTECLSMTEKGTGNDKEKTVSKNFNKDYFEKGLNIKTESEDGKEVEEKQGVIQDQSEKDDMVTVKFEFEENDSTNINIIGDPLQEIIKYKAEEVKRQHDKFYEKIRLDKEAEINNLKKYYETVVQTLTQKLHSRQHTIIRQRNKLATLRKQILRQKIKTQKMEDQLVSLTTTSENSDSFDTD